MKVLKIISVFVLVVSLMFGCANVKKAVVGACDFLAPYQTKVVAEWDKIRADYPMYEAIVNGVVPASISVVEKARAWIAAADVALATLGAVINGACRTIKESDVQKALAISTETLPKTALPPATLNAVKMKMNK